MPNTVAIHYLQFFKLSKEIIRYQSYLSADEIIRAKNFYFAHDQKNFILARGYLRELLGGVLELAPKNLQFTYGKFGKPALLKHPLKFNLSHNETSFVIAIAPTAELGIDIENIARVADYTGIAKQTFSLVEQAYLDSASASQKARVFYRCWARKEAYVKALGIGIISATLTAITATMQDCNAVTIENNGQHWQIYDLPERDGNCMAIAVQLHT